VVATILLVATFYQKSCQGLLQQQVVGPSATTTTTTTMRLLPTTTPRRVLAESTWRTAAAEHRKAVFELLQPGFVVVADPLPQQQQQQQKKKNSNMEDSVYILDRQNPIYNFLADYYGFKGPKGVKRLLRWSPGPDVSVLQGVRESDFAELLPLRGLHSFEPTGTTTTSADDKSRVGAAATTTTIGTAGTATYQPQSLQHVAAGPLVRYRQVLYQTLAAEPVLFCYGLHEWAMQYVKKEEEEDEERTMIGGDDPSTGSTDVKKKNFVNHYQPHLPRRVSADVIRTTVERRGVHCTHVDAIKYFTTDALPLNAYQSSTTTTDDTDNNNSSSSTRRAIDQLQWEQPACVHAHMDLLQYAMRLQPFIEAELFRDILATCLAARRLDVAASPYDATRYGLIPVPVEKPEGRSLYRKRQIELMERAQPLRQRLLDQYDCFIDAVFAPQAIEDARQQALLQQQSRT
jgi:hypothetical protein